MLSLAGDKLPGYVYGGEEKQGDCLSALMWVWEQANNGSTLL